MVTHLFHLYSRSSNNFILCLISFLSRVDELNKLACSQCMGLHSSAGRALQQAKIHHSTATVTYRKIPIIIPGLIFVQKAFNFAGLFSRELVFGGTYY